MLLTCRWQTADREGCTHLGPHEIKTPTGFKEAYQQYVEQGWQGLSYEEKWGGQGLPQSLSLVVGEIVATANWTFAMFPVRTRLAGHSLPLPNYPYMAFYQRKQIAKLYL